MDNFNEIKFKIRLMKAQAFMDSLIKRRWIEKKMQTIPKTRLAG